VEDPDDPKLTMLCANWGTQNQSRQQFLDPQRRDWQTTHYGPNPV
jgi:hypothetical protein